MEQQIKNIIEEYAHEVTAAMRHAGLLDGLPLRPINDAITNVIANSFDARPDIDRDDVSRVINNMESLARRTIREHSDAISSNNENWRQTSAKITKLSQKFGKQVHAHLAFRQSDTAFLYTNSVVKELENYLAERDYEPLGIEAAQQLQDQLLNKVREQMLAQHSEATLEDKIKQETEESLINFLISRKLAENWYDACAILNEMELFEDKYLTGEDCESQLVVDLEELLEEFADEVEDYQSYYAGGEDEVETFDQLLHDNLMEVLIDLLPEHYLLSTEDEVEEFADKIVEEMPIYDTASEFTRKNGVGACREAIEKLRIQSYNISQDFYALLHHPEAIQTLTDVVYESHQEWDILNKMERDGR